MNLDGIQFKTRSKTVRIYTIKPHPSGDIDRFIVCWIDSSGGESIGSYTRTEIETNFASGDWMMNLDGVQFKSKGNDAETIYTIKQKQNEKDEFIITWGMHNGQRSAKWSFSREKIESHFATGEWIPLPHNAGDSISPKLPKLVDMGGYFALVTEEKNDG